MSIDIRQGAEIHAQTFGQGPRPALALHCMLGTSALWGPVLSPLSDDITATAFDMPGHGQSAAWNDDQTRGSYQTLVTRIAASFIDRPVDLIGHSFGALVALRIAVAAPEAVRSLTLIEPVVFAAVAGTPVWDMWRARQDRLDAFMATGQAELAARDFIEDWGAGVPWSVMSAQTRAQIVAQMPIVANVCEANFTDPGNILRAGGLEQIDAPVLLIHGERSPGISADICTAIAARLPDVGVASVPNAGHMLPLTHARQLADLIRLNLERS